MEKDQALRKLSSYQSLSVGLKAYLRFILRETRFDRSEKICLSKTRLGTYCYIAKGSARIYYYDEDSEQEITVLFLPTRQMIPDTQITAGYLNGALYLEFLENTQLYSIPEKHLANIHKLFRESVSLTAALTAETLAKTIIALTGLKLLDANQRLKKLLGDFPDLFNVTPVKDVASYLGIHPTTLSAMRKKIK